MYVSPHTAKSRNVTPMPKVQEPQIRFMREWRDVMLLVDRAANLAVVARFAGSGLKVDANRAAREANTAVETAWVKLRCMYLDLHSNVSVLDDVRKRTTW